MAAQVGGLTRRRFPGWTQAALAAVGAGSLLVGGTTAMAAAALPKMEEAGEVYYAKLGVETIINAAGTYTYLTADVMPPQVRKAVERGALVSPGAARALTLATTAYLAQAQDKLRAEKPAIELNPATGTNGRGMHADERSIVLAAWMMQPGEEANMAKPAARSTYRRNRVNDDKRRSTRKERGDGTAEQTSTSEECGEGGGGGGRSGGGGGGAGGGTDRGQDREEGAARKSAEAGRRVAAV